MFHLDVRTLLAMLAINCLMVAIALPLIMGRSVSRAARCSQRAVALQASTWICLLLSGQQSVHWMDWALSSIAIASLSGSWLALWDALEAWLGPRRRAGWMKALALLAPLGYAIGFEDYAFRVGWSNSVLALEMVVLVGALRHAARPTRRHWRAMLALCLGALAVLTAWRGVLGAFFTDSYPNFLTPHGANLASVILSNVAVVLITVAILVAWREEAERLLQSQAVTDGLTGVLNRRAWTEAATVALGEAQRHDRALVVVMVDIDHFKRVNDEHGHETGDRALQLMAAQLKLNMRTGDLVGRYGGEEFCLLLNHATADTARALDQRLRVAVTSAARSNLGIALDFSAGLAARPHAPVTIDDLLREADAALYHAKRSGRSQMARLPEQASAGLPAPAPG